MLLNPIGQGLKCELVWNSSASNPVPEGYKSMAIQSSNE